MNSIAAHSGPPPSRNASDSHGVTIGEISYYFAVFGLVALLGLLGWFTLPDLTGGRLTGFAIMVSGLLMALASYLELNPRMRPASVLLVSLAISTTPLAVVGVQQSVGLIPILDLSTFPGQYGTVREWLSSPWLSVVLLTGLAALIAVVAYRYRFLVLILIGAAWALLHQINPMLASFVLSVTGLPIDPVAGIAAFTVVEHSIYFVFGILLMFCGAWTDLMTRREYAFWLYVCGAALGWYFGHHMLQETRLQLILSAMIFFLLPWFAAYLRRRILLLFAIAAGILVIWLSSELIKPLLMAKYSLSEGMWSGGLIGAELLLLLLCWPAARFFIRLEVYMNRRLPFIMELLRPAPRKVD